MSVRQYIGARYIPRFSEVNNGNWSSIYSYEPLTIVKNGNDYYTSKKTVPVGIQITDTEYWIKTGDYNGAITNLQGQIDDINTELVNVNGSISDITDDITQIKNQVVWYYPEAYGAVGDGSHDDTAAIQAMVDDMPGGSLAIFTRRIYKITDTINITKSDIRFSGICRAEYVPVIRSTKTSGDSIYVSNYGFSCNDLMFEGPTDSNTLTLISFNSDTDALQGNIDATFRNCGFFRAQYGIKGRGRNITFNDCIFSTLTYGIQAIQTSLNVDNRGYVVDSCRFHSCTLCFKNDINNNTTMKNIVITNNFCDYCGTLFNGNGGGVFICNNVFSKQGATDDYGLIFINQDNLNSSDILNVISDNVIIGKITSGWGVNIGGAKVVVKDNTFQYIGNMGIYAHDNAYVIVKNNVFNNCGVIASAVLGFAAGTKGLCCNNVFSNCDSRGISGGSGMTVSNNESVNN